MSDHGPETRIQVTPGDMFHRGRGYMSFQSHRTKGSHKSMHVPKCISGASRGWLEIKESVLNRSLIIAQNLQEQCHPWHTLCQPRSPTPIFMTHSVDVLALNRSAAGLQPSSSLQ
jgi:hypothetical protein